MDKEWTDFHLTLLIVKQHKLCVCIMCVCVLCVSFIDEYMQKTVENTALLIFVK